MNKTSGLLRKFQQVLPRPSLITIYKMFVTPHLDHRNAAFDQAFHNSFRQRLESIQYNTALRTWFRVITIKKMVSKILSHLQNNHKRITIISLLFNSKAIDLLFYLKP